MKDEIYKNLLNNRMLSNDKEIEIYEKNLDLLSESFSENDIVALCDTFEDKTQEMEVMFGAVHLLETLDTELAYEETIKGIVNNYREAPEWCSILVYRMINDEFSVQMLKNLIPRLDKNIMNLFRNILEIIKEEDTDKFGGIICEILGVD